MVSLPVPLLLMTRSLGPGGSERQMAETAKALDRRLFYPHVACVEASGGKLKFGDLFDEGSEVRKLIQTNYTIRRKVNLGTEPAVYYIV